MAAGAFVPSVADDPRAKKIMEGFKLVKLALRNAESGEVVWTSAGWAEQEIFHVVKEAHLPKRMLEFPSVGRQITFSTVEAIKDFRIDQVIYVGGRQIEKWPFTFGFVMPSTTNTWETIVTAAPRDQMLPAQVLSGNMYIVTSFYSADFFISRNVVRVFYE